MRRIAVVTSTRADYGLLRWVLEGIRSAADLELQLICTGSHLSPKHGSTYREIEADGFRIDRKIDLQIESDSPVGVCHAMGRALQGAGGVLDESRPDILVLLGDRYEILAVAAAAAVSRVPIAHLHGGEITEGAFDDAMRHAITKMAHLHFVAAEPYRRRVIQMGEQPDRVFLVGGLGVDAIRRTPLYDRGELEAALGFRFQVRNLLVTFHPATLDDGSAVEQTAELLAALESLRGTGLLFTLPNADPGNRGITQLIESFVSTHENARAYPSLGQVRYLSCIAQVDGVVGNSSSGLTEVPTFRKGTVNIGARQRGRLKADSVIDCEPHRDAIRAAIEHLYAPEFRARLLQVVNPYGEGGASEKVVDILRRRPLDGLLRKSFHSLPGSC